MSKELNQIYFDFVKEEKPEESVAGKSAQQPKEKLKTSRGRKSLKDMAEEAFGVQVPEDEILFQKQYYSIGDVASMFKVNTSLLRFWESEFGWQLRKNKKGDRFFTPKDIKAVQLIHDLLRRRRFTIEGAKDFLKKNKQADEKYILIQSMQRLRGFLLELKAHL